MIINFRFMQNLLLDYEDFILSNCWPIEKNITDLL